MYKKLECLEMQLENNGIIVKDMHIPINNVDGMCFSYSQDLFPSQIFNDIIVYDSKKLNHDSKKILNVLLHEEVHLEYPDTMYSIDELPYKIKQRERKTTRLISRKYISQDKLFELIFNRHMELYEISDELCLPEQLVQDAFDYYSQLESWINKKNKLLLNEF